MLYVYRGYEIPCMALHMGLLTIVFCLAWLFVVVLAYRVGMSQGYGVKPGIEPRTSGMVASYLFRCAIRLKVC